MKRKKFIVHPCSPRCPALAPLPFYGLPLEKMEMKSLLMQDGDPDEATMGRLTELLSRSFLDEAPTGALQEARAGLAGEY